MKDLISIIIPIFNAGRTLERCLDSVLSQTHSDIEVICVDDGSCDSCLDILTRYADKDPRVKIVGQGSDTETGKRAKGPATARNAGLDAATGEYIGFVDADDFIDPAMYERLLVALREGAPDERGPEEACDGTPGRQAELANCGRVSFFDDGSEKNIPADINETFISNNADSLGRLIVSIPDFIWDKLFVADIIRKEGIRFPDGRVYGEDTVFLVKYLCHVKKAVFIGDPLYHYNAHSEGSITNTLSDNWYDIFENLKDINFYLYELLDEKGFADIKPYLEELSIRYYDRRANAMIRYGEKGFQIKYVKYSFEFLKNNFPDWKKRMKAMDGVVFPGVKTSYLLMSFYILAPGFVKSRFAGRLAQ